MGVRSRLGRSVLLAGLLLAALGPVAAAPAAQAPAPAPGQGRPLLDVRDAAGDSNARPPASATRAQDALVQRLGPQTVVEVDPETGTPRALTRLDGALSGPSADGPVAVARRYLAEHVAALGLTAADLAGLEVSDRATSPAGLTVVRFAQVVDGVPAFDNGLAVGVDRAGRVVTVTGSPVRGLALAGSQRAIDAAGALAALRRSVGGEQPSVTGTAAGPRRETRFADGSRAALAVFAGAGAPRLAWELTYDAGGIVYHAAVDAGSGRLLYRATLTKFATSASVFPNYPGAPRGGTAQIDDLAPWLNPGETAKLLGPNAHAYSDLDDSDSANAAGEETAPGSYPLTTFPTGAPACTASSLCRSWDHTSAGSWSTNREQNAVQLFRFVNTFHDHLAAAPIGFTAADGNFEGADPVIAEADDGASTGPDSRHVNNANMYTPPDGSSPRMQMYLFSSASGSFNDVNGGDAAAIVYHEYTHGLSGRLVTTSSGFSALDTAQAGAMGEAWSDFYAMDFLNEQGYQADTAAPGEVDPGAYTDATPNQIRTQPLDCPVGASATACPGTAAAGSGGYTYGDFGRIAGRPEVHADGEIWGETLWDLRQALIASTGSTLAGSQAAERLVTDAMRLSPPQPSFLDMRNAILAADTAAGGANRALIWSVFARRGMGFFASTTDSADTAPVEDFSEPPAPGSPTGAVGGRVTDAVSGLPVAGVPVGFGGHDTGASFPDYFATTSGADGVYALVGLPAGRYPQLIARTHGGYDSLVAGDVAVSGGATTARDLALRRDFSALAGGAALTASTGDDYSNVGCGPDAALDQSGARGWSANNPAAGGATPSATIRLPVAITVTSFAIDPGAACGDGASAALRDYRIETSADGSAWTTAKQGSFAPADAGRLNQVAPDAGTTGVRYLKVTLLAPQSACAGCSGEKYVDLSELSVYGAPPNVPPSGRLVAPGTAAVDQAVTLDASSFSDPDSAITGYTWDFDGDGTPDATTTGPTVTHAYAVPGSYAPRVSVGDFRGGVGFGSAVVVVSAPPAPALPAPAPPPPAFALPPPSLAPLLGLPRRQPRGAVRLAVTCRATCTASVRVTALPTYARLLGGPRHRTIAVRRARLRAGARRTLTVAVSPRARMRLRRAHRRLIRAVVLVVVRDASGRTTRTRRALSIRL